VFEIEGAHPGRYAGISQLTVATKGEYDPEDPIRFHIEGGKIIWKIM
jgi:hypothetical protein